MRVGATGTRRLTALPRGEGEEALLPLPRALQGPKQLDPPGEPLATTGHRTTLQAPSAYPVSFPAGRGKAAAAAQPARTCRKAGRGMRGFLSNMRSGL